MYNKLFTAILDSSIWLEPDATRIVWVTLIAAMDETGYARFAAIENLAGRARVSVRAASKAVETLEGPDVRNPGQDDEGRRIERVPGGWMVRNALKYRSLATRALQREATRNRVRRHRERNRRVTDKPLQQPQNTEGETVNGSHVTLPVTNVKRYVTQSEAEAEAEAEAKTDGTRVRAIPLVRKRRKDAAWEGPRVYVPQRAHTDFVGLRNHPGAEAELLAWYADVSEDWTVGAHRHSPIEADMFVFWRQQYAERWPVVKPAATSRDPQWVRDARARRDAKPATDDDADAWVQETGYCRHEPRCEQAGQGACLQRFREERARERVTLAAHQRTETRQGA